MRQRRYLLWYFPVHSSKSLLSCTSSSSVESVMRVADGGSFPSWPPTSLVLKFPAWTQRYQVLLIRITAIALFRKRRQNSSSLQCDRVPMRRQLQHLNEAVSLIIASAPKCSSRHFQHFCPSKIVVQLRVPPKTRDVSWLSASCLHSLCIAMNNNMVGAHINKALYQLVFRLIEAPQWFCFLCQIIPVKMYSVLKCLSYKLNGILAMYCNLKNSRSS